MTEKNKWLEQHTGGKGLTRADVLGHYSREAVARSVLRDISHAPAMVYAHYNGKRILRRKAGSLPIRITKGKGDKPDSLEYWVKRHGVEFHREPDKRNGEIVLDIDPNGVYNKRVKKIVKDLAGIIKSDSALGQSMKDGLIVQFSGNRGYYIRGKTGIGSVSEVRKRLYPLVERYAKYNRDVVLGKPGKGETRIDMSVMRNGGHHRAIGSIDSRTGLVSRVVGDLDSFDPARDALPKEAN